MPNFLQRLFGPVPAEPEVKPVEVAAEKTTYVQTYQEAGLEAPPVKKFWQKEGGYHSGAQMEDFLPPKNELPPAEQTMTQHFGNSSSKIDGSYSLDEDIHDESGLVREEHRAQAFQRKRSVSQILNGNTENGGQGPIG